jgi:hypothetical protein
MSPEKLYGDKILFGSKCMEDNEREYMQSLLGNVLSD